jgi:hypothetical protein
MIGRRQVTAGVPLRLFGFHPFSVIPKSTASSTGMDVRPPDALPGTPNDCRRQRAASSASRHDQARDEQRVDVPPDTGETRQKRQPSAQDERDFGSPRVSGSTSEHKSSTKLVSVALSRLPPPPCAAHALAIVPIAIGQLIQPPTDRAARNPCGAHHSADPTRPSHDRSAAAKRPCSSSTGASTSKRTQSVDHPNLISFCESEGNPAAAKKKPPTDSLISGRGLSSSRTL